MADFLLQIWDVDNVSQGANVSRFSPASYGDSYYSNIAVEPCKQYSYTLTAVTRTGNTLARSGVVTTACREVERRQVRGRSLEGWRALPLRSKASQQTVTSLSQIVLSLAVALLLTN